MQTNDMGDKKETVLELACQLVWAELATEGKHSTIELLISAQKGELKDKTVVIKRQLSANRKVHMTILEILSYYGAKLHFDGKGICM